MKRSKKIVTTVLAGVMMAAALPFATPVSAAAADGTKICKISDGACVYNGHLYYVYTESGLSWESAKERCEALGGHLVTITSFGEQAFIESINGGKNRWIGACR
ncbi:MAG: lectin-like protein [Catonella sp.]|nr:lectin-like protein [Catonella sp.]